MENLCMIGTRVFWKKKDKNEKEFLSGSLDLGVLGTVSLAIFQNNKTDDNQPDCTIHLMTNKE